MQLANRPAEGGRRNRPVLSTGKVTPSATTRPALEYSFVGLVPLAVYGAGVGAAGLGVVDTAELFRWMTHALGIRFENPLMTEEALRLAADLEVQEPVLL